MECHAVHSSGHAELSNAIMNKAATIIISTDSFLFGGARVVRSGQICGTANHFWYGRDDSLQRILRGLSCRELAGVLSKALLIFLNRFLQTRRQVARHDTCEAITHFTVLCVEAFLPCFSLRHMFQTCHAPAIKNV